MSFAPIDLAADLSSFVALLRVRAELQAAGQGGDFVFLGDDSLALPDGGATGEDGRCTRWDFAALDRKARVIAAHLQAERLSGERALLLYPPGLEFLAAFFGCLYAGVVAVPAYLPRSDRALPRLRGIVADSTPRAVLTTESQIADTTRWFAAIPELAGASRWATDTLDDRRADAWEDLTPGLDSIAFLQYTSGSTGLAKGVVVTHGNLLSNSATIQRGFGSSRFSRGVSWLPLHHDMGLIGGALQTLYCGGSTTLFSPVAFLQRPVRWLELISRTGATISGGPNFAYDLCARRVTAEQKARLDLSRWTVAFNGAEPIRAETIDRFVAAFASTGFRRAAFLPCYGLAEATLIVSGGPPESSPALARLDPVAFDRGEIASAGAADSVPTRLAIGSGQIAPGHQVRIVDPKRKQVLPEHRVGEIWVAGPSVAAGYWNQPAATAATFGAQLADESTTSHHFLQTGDLGFVRDGELFVTGRLKDLIIIRGRNIYPQDVEGVVGRAHPSLAVDSWAAFAVERDGEERLVVVGEADRRTKVFDEVMAAVRTAVAADFDLDLQAIILLKPMTLPRTSSGKIRRREIRSQFLDGTLAGVVAAWEAAAVASASASPATPVDLQPPTGPPVTTPSAPAIARWLLARLAGSLGLPVAEIDPTRPFASFGLGSLRAVGLAGELEEWLGRTLSPTLLYEYPTVQALAGHLADGDADRGRANEVRPIDRGDDDRVAIIGVGCRFPGAAGPEAFWETLIEGVDAVGPVPSGRRGDFVAPDGTRGGFLDRVDAFDAEFFGIAPREAVWVDPQQRLLLEVAWEAMEDGGQVPARLAGHSVGVFVGVATNDYARLLHQGVQGDAYALTGNAASIAANRLSYTFDFRGPSLAVDTACSSSLVAIQQACRSLLAGESILALAGGVNLILAPELLADFASAGFLSSDARCKTFDAAADGYVRGEGAGLVVLKPLARALADGDPIRAVIRGGAINQDGRSNGLTAPSREAQEAVLRAAYRASGVEPGAIGYVEAHGTGTLLGDPIEARALGAVLAEGRPSGDRCWVGSAKTNIGHLEAAAGIAGTIKAALALEHGVIPPSLHFRQANPHIPFDDLPIAVAAAAVPWPRSERPRLAGVSSFGFGGTNAHLVLEASEPLVEPTEGLATPLRATYLLPVSAKTPRALAESARALRDRLAAGDLSLADAAFSSGARRSHLEHRLAVVADSAAEAVVALEAASQGKSVAGLASGRVAPGQQPRVVFVFSGQGSQWLGMARDLLASEPAFRAAVEGVDRIVVALSGWSVLSALAIEEEDVRLLEPEIAQPIQFAVQVGLAAVWRAWGVEPAAVVGHSLGEVAAAHAAGVLSLGDAVRLIILRGRLTQRAIGLGRTVAAGLSAAEADGVAAASEGRISVAAINGPTSTILSGDPDSILEQVDDWSAEGTFARLLNVDVAFHGPQMDPLAAELTEALVGIRPRASTIPLVSTVTGEWVDGRSLDAAYWGRNLRETVQFAAATQTLLADGYDTFLEVGPHPSLVASIVASARTTGRDQVIALGSLRRGNQGSIDLLQSLATLYVRGVAISWTGVTPTGRFVRLPSYPWQRERFWAPIEPTTATPGGHRGNEPSEPVVADPEPGLLYEVAWRPLGGAPEPSAANPGRWVICEDRGGVAHQLRRAVEARGGRCVSLVREATATPRAADRIVIESTAADLRRALADLAAGAEPIAGIISFWGLDAHRLDSGVTSAAELGATIEQTAGATLALVQGLEAAAIPARLWLVTAGAQAVGPDRAVEYPVQATIWGLGRSVRWERGGAWGGLVDLDPTDPAGSVAGLLAAISDPDGDDEQAIRGGERFAARLVRSERPSAAVPSLTIRAEGTYLITGGLGDLGLQAASWLVGRGARRLVLLGRRGLPPRSEWAALPAEHGAAAAIAAIEGFERHGATVLVVAADLADEARMRAVFDQIGTLLPPVRGIIHAAGTAGPAVASRDTSVEIWDQVLRPKIIGTWVLHRCARDLPLDFLVPFSSIAAVLGAKEVAYSAANGFLDAYAGWAVGQGIPVTSVGWGPWAGPGMAAHLARSHKLLGIEPLASDQAFGVLDYLLGGDQPARGHRVVADVDWFTFGVVRGGGRARRFTAAIDDRPRSGEGSTSRRRGGLVPPGGAPAVDLWRNYPVDQRREQVIRYFRDRVAGVLRLDPARVDAERRLDTLGLDSLMAIELKSGVEADLGITLPITRLLEGPTVAQLADQAIAQWNEQPNLSAAGPTVEPSGADRAALEPTRHPLSAGQRSLWLVHQRLPDNAAYNMAGAAVVRGELDVPALRRSLQVLVERHAALRTTFALDDAGDGEPVQVVHPPRTVATGFTVVDATGWSDERLAARLSEEARRPFDLVAAPPFRTTLFSRDGVDHRLVLSAHHIIGDFWSIALLMDELGQAYAADRAGLTAVLPVEPELRYTDFARWQAAHLAGPKGDRLRGYWGEVLTHPLPVLDLPTDRPRPSVRTQRGGTRSLVVDADLTARLQGLGAGAGASLYVTLLAAFQVLLARLTGQSDIIVGSPVAGRDRARLTDVVGYFANPLPVRSRLADDPTFADFLLQVRRTVFAGWEHQDLPFATMAEQFAASRDASRSPIFQAMFVFQKAQKLDDAGLTPFVLRGEGSKLAFGDFTLESVAVDLAASQFELTLAAAETDAGLALALEYNSDLFDAATADRILARFATLLRSVVAEPTRRVSRLTILPPSEWDQVVVAPNQTRAPFPSDLCVHRAIERQARLTPDAVAVAFRDVRLTYGELNARGNRLARHLRGVGVGPESRVGLGVERSADLVVGILGILKAGGAYVPLDPDYPRERLAYLLDDSGIKVLVTQSHVRDRMPAAGALVVSLDSDEAGPDQDDATDLDGGAGPEHAAYVIYTSGSTGRPKGVVVTHRNLIHSTHARVIHYQEPVRSFLLLASFAHDTSVAGLFWTLVQGGRLVIPVPGLHADPEHLTALVAEHEVTHLNCVPSLLRVILAESPAGRMDSLQVIFLGGQTCPHDLPELVRSQWPRTALHNEYGPTEATVWCTVHVCGPTDDTGPVPIGRPIGNAQAYILDQHLAPVPIGVAGELYIGGEGVTRGYLDRPGLTADRFLPDSFGGDPGGRLYRTGDLARWRADGSIDFLGRIDHQVKVRGYRIELGEVEAALNRHPGLTEAVAVAREDEPGDVRLVAYFVPKPEGGTTPTPGELRRWLKERLPDPLIPTLFVPVAEFPLSPNGKVDRQALPSPDSATAHSRRDEPVVAPRNAAEATLERLAATILGRDVVSIHADFFDLGIDSIRAIQLVSRARQAGLGLDPGQVFEHPSVAALASVASAVVVPTAPRLTEPNPANLADGVVETYPLAPMQEAMLYHSASNPGSGMYVQQFAAPIASNLDIPAFEAAWRAVIARHPVLRTSIEGGPAGRGRQVVHRVVSLPLEHRDWSDLSPGAVAERLDAFLVDDRTRGFDPVEPPLLRLTLIRTGVARFHLVLSNHHALMDGWCAPILLGEVLACYEANRAGEVANLPPTHPYRDYIDWLGSVDSAASEAFWRRDLRGFREPTPLPLAARRSSASHDPARVTFAERSVVVPGPVAADLAGMARRHRLTTSTVLAGAWALILGRHSGRDDVVFGVTVSGRPAELPGVESMIGLFINTLPIRVAIADEAPLADWLLGLQGKLVALRRHQSTPLVQVQQWGEVSRGRPLFETILVVENTPDDPAASARAERLGVGPLTVHERTNFPLTVTVVPGARLVLTARFDTARIGESSVDRLLEHFVHLLGEMADNPGAPLADLSLAAPQRASYADEDITDRPARSGVDLAQIHRLDGLSDEEVDALLAEMSSEGGVHP